MLLQEVFRVLSLLWGIFGAQTEVLFLFFVCAVFFLLVLLASLLTPTDTYHLLNKKTTVKLT